ncbi:hypothetical protein DUNSADRAFT_10252 [Dunaliella salina]|uniref:Uncharacterized protein n=1 Tax=Dunaliella salina TaxID=3046 RepID=A0ABQ7GFP6_DUNSA|nr:hypothetical protein DUNSADRAFT_10252 [Dunaliella salina]|eukprot:KAF5833426.1 hypothetical protein DUNSADRAFT_10252 [Dunaliella salina]
MFYFPFLHCLPADQRDSHKPGRRSVKGDLRDTLEALQKPAQCQPDSEALANTLLGLTRFGRHDTSIIRVLAHAVVERINSSKPREVSNTLWALSTLGWYDSSVYDTLLVTLVDERNGQLDHQDLSHAIHSCAMASHGGSAVEKLGHVISKQDVSQEGGWSGQDLANSLYAWAVLNSIGITSDSLTSMAQHLMREVNVRRFRAFQKPELARLYPAHLEAERVGLLRGGLWGNGMVQAAEKEHKEHLERDRAKLSRGDAPGVQRAAAALQEAGYKVEFGGKVGRKLLPFFYTQLLVHRVLSVSNIAVDVPSGTDVFCHPPGQLSGKARLKHAQIRAVIAEGRTSPGWRCDGFVVLSEGDTEQPDLVVQKVEGEMKSYLEMQT